MVTITDILLAMDIGTIAMNVRVMWEVDKEAKETDRYNITGKAITLMQLSKLSTLNGFITLVNLVYLFWRMLR